MPDIRQKCEKKVEALAKRLGSTQIVWIPDYGMEKLEVLEGQMTITNIRKILEQEWGHCQGTLADISREVFEVTNHTPPAVHYFEEIL